MRAQKDVVLGQLVTTNAGRDRGCSFVVVGFDDKGFLKLSDGRNYPIVKPKRKNVRHVKILGVAPLGLAEKIQGGLRVSNEELRQAITYFMKPDTN